jgi:hypothetical protein
MALMAAPLTELRPGTELDVDRLSHADREARQPDDHEANHEQHGARGGI